MGYLPLRISTVPADRQLTFDLYIHYKDQYLKLADSGSSINHDKLEKLKSQEVARFYIVEEDSIAYQKFVDDAINETIDNPEVSLDDKVDLVEGVAETAAENMQNDPENQSNYIQSQKAANNLVHIIQENPAALKKIYGKRAGQNEEIIKHSLNVCALATKLATLLKHKKSDIDDLGTAALIHDVGLNKLPKKDIALFKKLRKEYSTDEHRAYMFHANDSANMLAEKPYVNHNVAELIRNHEENLSGTGPNRKKKLTQLEEILSMVNCYDKRLLNTPDTTPAEVVKRMQIEEMGNYSLNLINQFMEVLKAEGLVE